MPHPWSTSSDSKCLLPRNLILKCQIYRQVKTEKKPVPSFAICRKSEPGLPLIISWKIPWIFTNFWTIFTDLKLARWMIKNTETHWSKLLFLQTSLKLTIFHDAFLTENIIPWLLQPSKIFPDILQNSLTFPWPWKIYVFHWLFPDLGNPASCQKAATFQQLKEFLLCLHNITFYLSTHFQSPVGHMAWN